MNKIDEILLHLYESIDYGFSYRAKKMFFIDDIFPGGYYKDKQIKESIRDLNKTKLIEKKRSYDGSIIISLTEKGRLRALNIRFRRLRNRKEKWDGKWRMIAFDIPEKCRKGRDAIRYRMQAAEFYELQESLFLYPYDCQKEIEEFCKLFKLEKYVHFALLDFIDVQDKLIKVFKLA